MGGMAIAVVIASASAMADVAGKTDRVQGGGAVAAEDADHITLNFPDNTPLATLIAYVSTRLSLNIVYDDAQVNQRITLRTPAPIPESALLDLLQTVLRARNLVLQETTVPGLMRVVPSQQLAEVADLAEAEALLVGLEGAVTQVFPLEHARAERVNGLVAPFLSKPGGTIAVLPEERLLVVTDYVENMTRIGRLLELVDTPRGEAVILPIEIRHGNAQDLLRIVQPLLQARARATGDPQAERSVMVAADPRTNHLLVVGLPTMVDQAADLVASLDRRRDLERRVYRPQLIPPDRLDAVVQKVLVPEPTAANYRAAADTKSGTFVVTAPPRVHEEIGALLAELDTRLNAEDHPVRFYRLTNTLAADVLDTIRSLQDGGGGRGGLTREPPSRRREYGVIFDRGSQRERSRDFDPRRDTFQTYQIEAPEPLFESTSGEAVPAQPATPEPAPPSNLTVPVEVIGGVGLLGDGERRATVAMDPNTNSIIVIAPPAEQRIYGELIRRLDQRRPQVLIETTLVSLDTSDGFSFGVDVGFGSDDGRIISFSQFGLSVQDTEAGELALPETPGTGGTLALLEPDVADVVVRALATASRSRLVSMPRVLVNDNETGILDSLQQEPYIVTVVPGGGDVIVESTDFAEAGTTIQVTPHISEDDYLQLEYAIELSSFTGQPATNLPPPVQRNAVESVVTIPDGHTIVVGGLNQQNLTETIEKIPLLGDIPLVKHLFRSTVKNDNNSTLFVFIRPTILRDDRFRDLKYISAVDRRAAEIADDLPSSEPLLMTPAPIGAGGSTNRGDAEPDLLLSPPESDPLPMIPE